MRKIPGTQLSDYDEHNQPTEPMSPIILSPHATPTYTVGASNGASSYDWQTVPAPPPPELPFPQSAYPVLPPASGLGRNGRPPGGAAPFSVDEKAFSQPAYPHRSPFPSIVGSSFVLVQLLLLLRVVLLLFGVSSNNNILVELVYALGMLFAWPFQLLLDHLNLPSQIGAEWINYLAALIAILAYGVFARILVRFLKALLHSR